MILSLDIIFKKLIFLDNLINLLGTSVCSLTNPSNVTNSFKSNGYKDITVNTINSYLIT